ncbi:hypothetical protein SAMN03159475_4714 [Pseudomonas sp. NFPP33]|nr:hypothetical protein [Pseudomonas sp. NFPP33]SDA82780.1 hypothetical protein SAMN03159475_4714 [Pseudomonas sp. NFPP33]
MSSYQLDRAFRGIWQRAQNLPSLSLLTPELIGEWARKKGLLIKLVERRKVGAFRSIECIVLDVGEGRACFPVILPEEDADWIAASRAAECDAQIWAKMEWFCPLWVSNGSIRRMLSDAAPCSKERAVELFGYHTSTIYTLAFQAVCIAQLMPRAHSLREFYPIAREAYLAFYSGYRASSISALIPAIEGALTKIVAGGSNGMAVGEKVDRAIDRAIQTAAFFHFDKMWVPSQFRTQEYLFGQDERVFVFETFRRWLKTSFFRNTGEYDGVTWLNRHLFAHGASSEWQRSANFTRLVVALATLGVIESWYDESNAVTLFFPEMNDESKLLWQQALFRANAQAFMNSYEEKQYHEHGRLVPEMPTDDGVLLRAALLSEDCIKDLVRPLRDAGWSVKVGEPDERALWVKVVATGRDKEFEASLLYSCATDNKIYRELAETSEFILYRGAPYKQDQYAYGVKVHVGPVTAWQPPLAPNSRGSN